MSFVCNFYVICMYSYVTSMSLVCHLYVIVCHPYVTCMYSYVTRMSPVCHSYVLVCHPHVNQMYSYFTHTPLVCTCMSPLWHSHVIVCHPYVTRLRFYHEPVKTTYLTFLESLFTMKLITSQMSLKSHICCIINGVIRRAKILVRYSQGKNTIK